MPKMSRSKPRRRSKSKQPMSLQRIDIREHRERLRDIDRPGGGALGWFIALLGMALLWTILHQNF